MQTLRSERMESNNEHSLAVRLLAFLICLSIVPLGVASRGNAESLRALLLISVDGMRPDYVTQASAHGLKIPHLLQMLTEGSYASGVRGALPTVTYPSHTTILTGVWPARHGIFLNTTFDPLNKNLDGWYWYTQDIHVPTLWEAASHAGMTVASVSWPVSVGAHDVRYLIPEFWRAGTPDDLKLLRTVSTPGLLSELQEKLGPYITDLNNAVAGDRQRTRYAAEILRAKQPEFMTVHLAALDHLEHQTGPFSPESNETLEQIDQMIGELEDALRSRHPDAAICVVSDHGFTRTDHHLHLMVPFAQEGFIKIDPKTVDWPEPRVLEWSAVPWVDGGSAAIVLKDPANQTVKDKVAQLLSRLTANTTNGIAQILDQKGIAARGGAPTAAFWVDMKSNYVVDKSFHQPLVTETKIGGSHGYSPDNPDLEASFFIMGPNIRKGVNLGKIDMRSIAPTLAHYLNVSLPSADLAPLELETP
ncbi:MAG TPA: ectonucleotide pyrophosphatase/phosphodiesterase [Bryobacteraceae bacterium]|nr:ectonucleotide pyrophosphatase/phosphodiesterase [Bryobacteraceae bacterium]